MFAALGREEDLIVFGIYFETYSLVLIYSMIFGFSLSLSRRG